MFTRALQRATTTVRSAATPSSIIRSSAAPSARFFNSTEQHIEPSTSTPPAPQTTSFTPITATPAKTGPVSDAVKQMLPLLKAQPNHYISAHIHGRPYLLTVGDTVRLPFQMPGVAPGDVLRLNRASAIGSRDYTLKGPAVPQAESLGNKEREMKHGFVDERLFEARAIVMGTEGEPVRIKIKKKQRTRRSKRVVSKHKFTVLKLVELSIKDAESIV